MVLSLSCSMQKVDFDICKHESPLKFSPDISINPSSYNPALVLFNCYVICSVCCCSVLIVFLVLLFRCYAGVLLFCFSVIFWLFYQSSGIAPVFWCSWFYSMPKHNCPNWTKILPEMLHTENECIVFNT